jgi:hypothetical protein
VREGGALEMRDRKLWTRVHNRVWTATAATVIALGLFGSVAAWGPMPALAAFLSAATLGGVCHLSIASLATPDTVAWRHIAVGALLVGALTLALGGLLAISGSGAVWVVVLLGVTWSGWPAQLRRLRPARSSPRTPKPDRPALPNPVTEAGHAALEIPDRLEDADLCLAWRSSFVAMQRATTLDSRLRIVLIRALYLDEMERSNPAAFVDWLSASPRAATSPRASLAEQGRSGSTWSGRAARPDPDG